MQIQIQPMLRLNACIQYLFCLLFTYSNTTNVKVKLSFLKTGELDNRIQIQPMLRLNKRSLYNGGRLSAIQIQPMLRLNLGEENANILNKLIQIQPMLRLN